ncbi:hypothetical protein FUAX_40900 (plasmid) [Fulvitalea axinellae]|uniref:Uncharacterized protein n=1 Tax=Fulvitalea axinellae TaxID=1182444 RepID=A0AAU9CUB5_9BACT|nr:hypothetical protein FUAX_40900 [Fulvitalea axinellae]
MAVQVEIWQKDIQEAVFKDNEFLRHVHDESEYVLNGAVVHIPQSGGPGNVEKNRGTLPASIRRRDDTDIVYPLDEYTTDPTLITNAEKVELSYDKRNSVIGEDKQALKETVAEDFFYKWAKDLPASSIIETSGASTGATADSATGNRKSCVRDDLKKAKVKLNKQGVSKEDRFAVLPSDMESQLFPDDQTSALLQQNLTEEERRMGVIAKLHSFKVLERSTVLVYASDGTLKAPGSAGASGDCEGALCWQKGALSKAMGTVKFFEEQGKPEYYGDLCSMLVRAGGRRRRKDNKGVVVIRQATA